MGPAVAAPDDDAPGPEDPDEAADGRAARAQRRRTERRSAILDAAKRVFRQKGYHEASVHDVIDGAQIARGTFYLYFESKQDVFGELVAEFLALIRGQVHRITVGPDADPPLLQLRANFRRVLTTIVENEDLSTIILRDPTAFDADTGVKVGSFFDRVLRMIADALAVGRGLGLVGECDTNIVAVTALGGVRQTLAKMLEVRTRAEPPSPTERSLADPEAVADALLRFYLRGLAPRPDDGE